MAMERRRSQYPSPRSKSGARWRQTTTDKGHVAQMRIVLSGQSNALIALLNKQHGGKIRMATITRCVEAVLLSRMAPVTATPDLSVISVLTWLNSPWLHHVATSYAGHACSSGSMQSPFSECPVCKVEVLMEANVTPLYGRGGEEGDSPTNPDLRRQQMADTRRQLIQN